MVFNSTQAGIQTKAEDCVFASFLCSDILIFKEHVQKFYSQDVAEVPTVKGKNLNNAYISHCTDVTVVIF